MHFLLWLIIGGLVGGIASLVMQGPARLRFALNIVIGATGAFIGAGFIAPLLGWEHGVDAGTYSTMSIVIAVAGAAILLVLFNLVRHRLPLRR